MAQSLSRDRWNIVGPTEYADLYIINSCTVTAEADRQTRQAVRRALRQNPLAHVVVTGCYAQNQAQACAEVQETSESSPLAPNDEMPKGDTTGSSAELNSKVIGLPFSLICAHSVPWLLVTISLTCQF